MLPSELRETIEIGIGRNHVAAMFHRNCGVLRIRDQLSGCACGAAQMLEYGHVVGSGTDDARRRPFHERRHERERRVQSRRRIEHAGIGRNPNEAGKDQDGKGERLRAGCQTDEPIRILGMIRSRVLDMGVDQDVDIGKQHWESTVAALEFRFVLLRVERPRPVEIDAAPEADAAHGEQLEGRRFRTVTPLEGIVQGYGNEGAHTDAPSGCFAAHLPGESVIEGDGRPHGE